MSKGMDEYERMSIGIDQFKPWWKNNLSEILGVNIWWVKISHFYSKILIIIT